MESHRLEVECHTSLSRVAQRWLGYTAFAAMAVLTTAGCTGSPDNLTDREKVYKECWRPDEEAVSSEIILNQEHQNGGGDSFERWAGDVINRDTRATTFVLKAGKAMRIYDEHGKAHTVGFGDNGLELLQEGESFPSGFQGLEHPICRVERIDNEAWIGFHPHDLLKMYGIGSESYENIMKKDTVLWVYESQVKVDYEREP